MQDNTGSPNFKYEPSHYQRSIPLNSSSLFLISLPFEFSFKSYSKWTSYILYLSFFLLSFFPRFLFHSHTFFLCIQRTISTFLSITFQSLDFLPPSLPSSLMQSLHYTLFYITYIKSLPLLLFLSIYGFRPLSVYFSPSLSLFSIFLSSALTFPGSCLQSWARYLKP